MAVELDACGIGFVADSAGRASRSIVQAALTGLACVKHRGALAADARSSDGSGLLVPIPPALFGNSGVAVLFVRGDDPRPAFEAAAAAEGVKVLEWRTPPTDAEQLGELARQVQIEISERVVVDGVDATAAIRDEEVTGAVSAVAAHPGVREEMVRRQREWAAGRSGGVVEGRDIGSVVFPDADVKVYLTASDTERAQRRAGERRNQDYDAVAADLARRDRFDSSRASSPLLAADDAMVIDTTGRGVDDIVQEVLGQL